MNKNLKIVLVLLSIIVLSILGVRKCMSEHGDLSSLMFKAVGMSDDSDKSSQDHSIYQLDEEGDYIRLKGKKTFRNSQDIAKDYYVYITNSSFSNIPPMKRVYSEDSLDYSMTTMGLSIIKDKKIETSFSIYEAEDHLDDQMILLISQVLEEKEEDMNFDIMTGILERQIDEIWKKMYPEDIILLDQIKSEISENIIVYTNMDNHLETDHTVSYDARVGQFYVLWLDSHIGLDVEKQFYSLNVTRMNLKM